MNVTRGCHEVEWWFVLGNNSSLELGRTFACPLFEGAGKDTDLGEAQEVGDFTFAHFALLKISDSEVLANVVEKLLVASTFCL